MSKVKTTPLKGNGKVFIVGAGPGDEELLTVKALRIIQSCDVILYDKLVSREIQALFPKGTKRFFVGKSKDKHSVPQNQLNQLLVTLAKKGLSVCRLKGGDPFIFGRGSEELTTIHQSGIKAEVVPGITAASGCSSYAGIPLTHRGLSQGCTFITGHAEKSLDINWSSLAKLKQTLVFYMGLSQLSNIRQRLTENGLSAETPAALIENGCRQSQRVFCATLADLEELANQHQLKSPTLIVIGEVVSLKEQLEWFETSAIQQSMNTDLGFSQVESTSKRLAS